MNKKLILLIFSILHINLMLNAQCEIKDSLRINTYELNIDLSNWGTKSITGIAKIGIESPFDNVSEISLDLSSNFTVTKVLFNEAGNTPQQVNFNHADSKLTIPGTLNKGNYEVSVSYNGMPEKDPSGWGGFYFSGVYAWNLGVGFEVNPHNYGRAWFPCVDNFTSRATYKFIIKTLSTNKAFCNGLLTNITVDNMNGTTTWEWTMNDPIPTYLASVAVAPYSTISMNYNGLNGDIPITLAALPADTNKVKASFENLPGAIGAFEAAYGAHTFSRVGFNMVPFNGGAMEHATNIAYPLYAANGTKDKETLYAHELSHHWWGNTVTCCTAADMWINEGWASYSENIFLESVYGKNEYRNAVRANHYNVLRWAHLRDGQARAIQGIPHEYTYGMHVYNKGSDVVHTLRSYMGDDAFFEATKAFISLYKFMGVTSQDLRDEFQKHTNADLIAFFKNWVFTQGFPHFELTSVKTSQNGNEYQNEITISQKQRFTSKLYTGVPLEISFFSSPTNRITKTVTINNYYEIFKINTPFIPKYVAIDYDEKISDAITDAPLYLTTTGSYSFPEALMTINVSEAPTEALIRIEHHWVGPDASKNSVKGLYPSNSRYWTVDGIIPNDFVAKATIIYDGRTPANLSSGYLDNNHIRITEDSLMLMYRPNKLAEWVIYDDYTKNTGGTSDKFGSIIINNLKKGDYCFAMYDQTLSAKEPIKKTDYLAAYPNPTDGLITFKVSNVYTDSKIVIVNSKGAVMDELYVYANENNVSLDTSRYSKGIYFASVMVNGTSFERVKFIVK